MPEFQLNTWRGRVGVARAFDKLDSFARGYVEAMFFTNGDTGDDNENRLNEIGVHKLTKAACDDIAETCKRFQKAQAEALEAAYETGEYSEEQAGRDLWFSRQGHGVGYFDRDALAIPYSSDGRYTLGYMLSEAARRMGEAEVYVKRGNWIEHVG